MDTETRLASLPPALHTHAAFLRRFLAAIATDPRWRWLELSCSVAEGRGDEDSDLDMGLGVDGSVWPRALEALPDLLASLGPVVDTLQHRIPQWGDTPHQRTFAQYADGLQLDLVAMPASLPKGKAPGSLILYDPQNLRGETREPAILRPDAAAVREWTFLGWAALADLAKYLVRGSLWEALERLHTARTFVWRLWATSQGVPYPVFGLTSVLDHPETGIPREIEETVAGLDETDIRRAAHACARLISETSRAAAAVTGAALPCAFEGYVRARLNRL